MFPEPGEEVGHGLRQNVIIRKTFSLRLIMHALLVPTEGCVWGDSDQTEDPTSEALLGLLFSFYFEKPVLNKL